MTGPAMFVLTAVGALGLAVGSFLNVVIYRVPRHKSLLFPASHCPKCETAIAPWHNVPVLSWMALRRRCASCASPISARYPLVEAGTGALFVAITAHFGLSVQLPAYLFLAAVGVTLAMIDLDVRRLPDSILLPSYAVGVLLLMPAGAAAGDWRGALRALASMLALLAIYFALSLAYPHALGLDAVKLAGLAGLFLGWQSWSAVVIGAFGAFLLAGVGGCVFLASGRIERGAAIRLGPYLVAATVLALFLTSPLTAWYSSLLAA